MRILIVDDEPSILRFCERLLRRFFGAGIEVATAATADEAISQIQAAEPALIVCDFDLFDGSKGSDILAWIRESRPALEPHFLFASGNADVEDLGARFVSKPYTMAELRAALAPELGA